jgi:plastocyanin
VPAGQKVSGVLDNHGVMEHDVTVQAASSVLRGAAGQVATGEFTFATPGTFDFVCSIAGTGKPA